MTVTATATPNSPYEGSVSTEVTIDKLTYQDGKHIEADVDDTLVYQYTGKAITIPNDKVTLKETKKKMTCLQIKINWAELIYIML